MNDAIYVVVLFRIKRKHAADCVDGKFYIANVHCVRSVGWFPTHKDAMHHISCSGKLVTLDNEIIRYEDIYENKWTHALIEKVNPGPHPDCTRVMSWWRMVRVNGRYVSRRLKRAPSGMNSFGGYTFG